MKRIRRTFGRDPKLAAVKKIIERFCTPVRWHWSVTRQELVAENGYRDGGFRSAFVWGLRENQTLLFIQ